MKPSSLFGETVIWSGRPKVVGTPTSFRIGAGFCGIASAIATASAIVVSTIIGSSPGALLLFAGWMASLAIAFAYGPMWWRSQLEFIVTDRHIVLQRGRLRRSIERRAVSFARIHWHPKHPGVGDLELVRAVPTGALRRRLSIVLSGLVAPDRVWAIIRGVTPSAPAGDGHRLLAQRLDNDERVLWSGQPQSLWRKWLPSSWRASASIGFGLLLAGAAVFISMRAAHALRVVMGEGVDPESVAFVALVTSVSLPILMIGSTAAATVYVALVRPAWLEAKTRYLITDRRVLIQRGHEELHLDRSRIVDVIDAPGDGGLRDLFLVLDGPAARALASSGAFGEAPGDGLLPVLYRVADADSVRRILHAPANDVCATAA